MTFNKTADPKADIRVSFNPKTGSYSAIGIAAKDPSRDGQATLNLGWIKEGAEFTNENRGVTLHEFGHALGLLHEHQSPARGGKLTLKDAGKLEFLLGVTRFNLSFAFGSHYPRIR